MRLVRIFTLLTVVLALGACAYSEDVVDLNYAPDLPRQSIGADGKQLSLEVRDLLGSSFNVIGTKVNGYGMPAAEIKSSVPLRDVLWSAFAQELAARNLVVADSTRLNLVVGIQQMKAVFLFGLASGTASAVTAFSVKLEDANGTVLFADSIAGSYEEDGVLIASGSNAALAVEGSLRAAMRTLFADQTFLNALANA